jgi:tRNA(Ser,Leu) C12 N-acetylase TAN1
MLDWNVIVTISGDRFKTACEQLRPFGLVKRTPYYNVLAMKVDDIRAFMDALHDSLTTSNTEISESIARVAPVSEVFTFQTAAEFESKAREHLASFIPQLAGRRFHVRIHRRGWKERINRHYEEQSLGSFLFDELAGSPSPAKVSFDDPDYIVTIEILDNRAGVALWSHDDLRRYSFLKLD